MLEELLKECQSSPLNAETAEKLIALRSEALAEKTYPIYWEATRLLANFYESNQEFDQAILLLKEPLENEISEQFQPTVALVDQLIGLLLKTEDFVELEAVLHYRERFIEENKALKRMQLFYLAVCYEGLKKTDLAIQTLLSIPDTLSSSNLVSKYLKLALLYLDKKEIAKAEEMALYARHFDREQKNPIFLLVDSDLAYQKGDYLNALEHYQSYYLAAKVKNRYLERFIRINLQLLNLEDAWAFFIEHLPKVERMISKHARREFYQAGLDLSLKYQQLEMVLTLKEKLAMLDHPSQVTVDSFQGLERLLKRSAGRLKYAKSRDVLLEHCRDLMDQVSFDRLIFIALDPDGIRIMTYQKGLLLEKVMSFSLLKDTLIDVLLSSDQEDLLYTKTELSEIRDYLLPNNFIDMEYVIASRIRQEIYPHAFLAAFIKETDRFMHHHKLFCITRILCEMRLSDHLFKVDQTRQADYLEKGFDLLGTGLIKIEKGVVLFLTEATKSMFGMTEKTITFERFQSGFVSDKPIYLDAFLTCDHLTLGYQLLEGTKKQFSLRIWREELRLLMTIKDITQAYSQTSKLTAAGLEDFLYGIKPINLIPAEYRVIPSGHTLLAFHIHGLSAYFSTISNKDTLAFGFELEHLTKQVAKQVYVDLYLADPEHFLIMLSTTDKRVIERIVKDIRIQFASLIKPEHPTLLSFAAYLVSKPVETQTIKSSLIQLLYTKKKSVETVHYLGKAELETFALWDSIAAQIGHLIQEKRLLIDYYPVGTWKDRTICFLEADLAKDLGFHQESDLFIALERAELLEDYLDIFLQQLCHDLKKDVAQTDRFPPIVIRFNQIFTGRLKLIERALKTLKSKRISDQHMIIVLEYDPLADSQFWEAVTHVKQSNYRLGIAKWITYWQGSRLEQLRHFSIAYVESDELHQLPGPWLDIVKDKFSEGLIFDHGTSTLKKSELTELGITLVKGELFPPLRAGSNPLSNSHSRL